MIVDDCALLSSICDSLANEAAHAYLLQVLDNISYGLLSGKSGGRKEDMR